MPPCGLCGLHRILLAPGILMCARCDTSLQHSGLRVGPPKMPGAVDGWFTPTFGDLK